MELSWLSGANLAPEKLSAGFCTRDLKKLGKLLAEEQAGTVGPR
jgi:hypothetical protein